MHPDVAKAFIGKVGKVRGMWIPSDEEDKRAFIIDVKIDELYKKVYDTISLPISSIEPCIPKFTLINIGDIILFMDGPQQETGVVEQVLYEKEKGTIVNCLLLVVVEKPGSTKYKIVSTEYVIGKAATSKEVV